MNNMEYFDPFAFCNRSSEYQIIPYLIVDGAHSMGKFTARIASLHHLFPMLLRTYDPEQIGMLDLSGKMNTHRQERWYASSNDLDWIKSLSIYSKPKYENLYAMENDPKWIKLKERSEVIVLYGLHHYSSATSTKYRDIQREVLRYLPTGKPIYWMVYPENGPKHVDIHRRQAVRPFKYNMNNVDYYSILPVHMKAMIMNIPTKIQGKSLLPLRDDQRVVFLFSTDRYQPELDFKSIHKITNNGIDLEVSLVHIPVLRDYSFWYENIHSIPGAQNKKLLQPSGVLSWIDDYLQLVPWFYDSPRRPIKLLDLEVDYSDTVQDYFQRIRIDNQTKITFNNLMQKDDTRLISIRNRRREQKHRQTTGVPLPRRRGPITKSCEIDEINKAEHSELRGVIKAVKKFMNNETLTLIFDQYLNSGDAERLYLELDQIIMEFNTETWLQIKSAISSYNNRLRVDWSVVYIPTVGRWLQVFVIPAIFDIGEQSHIDDIYLKISQYFSLIDRKLGLIDPVSFRYDRQKIIKKIIFSMNVKSEDVKSRSVTIPYKGKILYVKIGSSYKLCLQFDGSPSDLSWFSTKQIYPSDDRPQIKWHRDQGINKHIIEDMLDTDTVFNFIIVRTRQRELLYVDNDNEWRCVATIHYMIENQSFKSIRLTLYSYPPLSLSDIPPVYLKEITYDQMKRYAYTIYRVNIDVTPYSFILVVYSGEDQDEIDVIEFDTTRDLLDCIKRGYVVDSYDEKLRFNRFDIGFEDEYGKQLSQIFQFLSVRSNRDIDLYLMNLPEPSEIYDTLTNNTALDWITEIPIEIEHFKSQCIASKLTSSKIESVLQRTARAMRDQGYFHQYCFGIEREIDTESDDLLLDIFSNNQHFGIKITREYMLLPPETIAFLHFMPLVILNNNWYTVEVQLIETSRHAAQEDIDLLSILNHNNSRQLKLLKFGSYLTTRDLELNSIYLDGSGISAVFEDRRSGFYFDVLVLYEKEECIFVQTLKDLLEEPDTSIVDLFPKLESYHEQLIEPDQLLTDHEALISEITSFIEDHEIFCEVGCDTDKILVIPPGFDDECDPGYYELSVWLRLPTGQELNELIIDRTDDVEEYINQLADLLDTGISERGLFFSYFSYNIIYYEVGFYSDLISIFLHNYLDQTYESTDILQFLTYTKVQKYLNMIKEPIENYQGDILDLFELREQSLYYSDICQVVDCTRSTIIFHTREIWHVGLCSDHQQLSHQLQLIDWKTEDTPPYLPFVLNLSIGSFDWDAIKRILIVFLRNRSDHCCIFNQLGDCDDEIMSMINSIEIFGRRPMVCITHFPEIAVVYLLEFMISSKFSWQPVEEMITMVDTDFKKINLDQACTYLLMSQQLNFKDMTYHYLMVVVSNLFKTDLVVSQGFLQLARDYQMYYESHQSDELSPRTLYYLLGRNMRRLGSKFIKAHEIAIQYFDEALRLLHDKSHDELSWYQTSYYMSNSLIELGEFDAALQVIPKNKPKYRNQKSENIWSELIITDIIIHMELAIRGNNYISYIQEKLSDLESYLYRGEKLTGNTSHSCREKISKLGILRYRFNLLYHRNLIWGDLIKEINRIMQLETLTVIDHLILREYCHHAFINQKNIDTEVIALYVKELNSIIFNYKSSQAHKIILYFDITTTFVLLEQNLEKISKLVKEYMKYSKDIDMSSQHRFILVKYFLLYVNENSEMRKKILMNDYDILTELYQNLSYFSPDDFILDPGFYARKSNMGIERLKKKLTDILERSRFNQDIIEIMRYT